MMEQETYEIHIKGHLNTDWSDWFAGMQVTNLAGGETMISGGIPDQAALYGVLARVFALNLKLLGVRCVAPDGGERVRCGPPQR